MSWAIIVDLDHDDGWVRAHEFFHFSGGPEPSWIIENTMTGHVQMGWMIEPVSYGERSWAKPQNLQQMVYRALVWTLDGDKAFTQGRARNPFYDPEEYLRECKADLASCWRRLKAQNVGDGAQTQAAKSVALAECRLERAQRLHHNDNLHDRRIHWGPMIPRSMRDFRQQLKRAGMFKTDHFDVHALPTGATRRSQQAAALVGPIEQGERNSTVFTLTMAAAMRGDDFKSFAHSLTCDPPLLRKETESIIASVGRRVGRSKPLPPEGPGQTNLQAFSRYQARRGKAGGSRHSAAQSAQRSEVWHTAGTASVAHRRSERSTQTGSLVAEGLTIRQIAEHFGVSKSTAKRYKRAATSGGSNQEPTGNGAATPAGTTTPPGVPTAPRVGLVGSLRVEQLGRITPDAYGVTSEADEPWQVATRLVQLTVSNSRNCAKGQVKALQLIPNPPLLDRAMRPFAIDRAEG
ncbi:replication initiation protein [Arthrobacter rhombi]|nr:replication initiation protein [Arthrobacter rhombi]